MHATADWARDMDSAVGEYTPRDAAASNCEDAQALAQQMHKLKVCMRSAAFVNSFAAPVGVTVALARIGIGVGVASASPLSLSLSLGWPCGTGTGTVTAPPTTIAIAVAFCFRPRPCHCGLFLVMLCEHICDRPCGIVDV